MRCVRAASMSKWRSRQVHLHIGDQDRRCGELRELCCVQLVQMVCQMHQRIITEGK